MAKRYPQIGEVFDLTLDGSLPENTPLGVIKVFHKGSYEYNKDNPEDWRHNGQVVTDKQTRKFMLVKIGNQPNLAAAKSVLEKKYGTTPEGQWMKAFKDAYPKDDGNGPIGVADSSWIYPNGHIRFPCVHTGGRPHFDRGDYDLYTYWRWLVPAAK